MTSPETPIIEPPTPLAPGIPAALWDETVAHDPKAPAKLQALLDVLTGNGSTPEQRALLAEVAQSVLVFAQVPVMMAEIKTAVPDEATIADVVTKTIAGTLETTVRRAAHEEAMKTIRHVLNAVVASIDAGKLR